MLSLLLRAFGRGGRTTSRHAARPPRRTVLRLEALEERAVPATFTVTRLADDVNAGSLRWAITQANADTGPDETIDFQAGLRACE
jgi:hypothetical protein